MFIQNDTENSMYEARKQGGNLKENCGKKKLEILGRIIRKSLENLTLTSRLHT